MGGPWLRLHGRSLKEAVVRQHYNSGRRAGSRLVDVVGGQRIGRAHMHSRSFTRNLGGHFTIFSGLSCDQQNTSTFGNHEDTQSKEER